MRASVSGLASSRGGGSRPSSQVGRDQLVIEAQGMPLAGKLLHVRVYHVTGGTPGSTPLAGLVSPPRSTTSDPIAIGTSNVSGSQSLGFRVLAIDELDNEFSLFVSRQKAEYLFQPQSSSKSTSQEDASAVSPPSLEALGNSIIDHLDIIGNRHRDIGKLTCREPEVFVAKRTRATPARDAASKQKNPHLMVKNDQRATRAKKTVLRTMEAIATAQRVDTTADAGHGQGSPLLRHSRKSSDESLLHRMAFSNEKPMWRSDLETSFEEQQASSTGVAPTAQVGAKTSSTAPVMVHSSSATTAGSSPPRRAIPERKHKHKGLYERREKERKHRLLVARAKSSSNILEPDSLIDMTSPVSALALLEQSGEEEERLRSARDSRNIRARFNAAVRTAYAVRTFLGVKAAPEPEQFLRRRNMDHSEHRVFNSTDTFGAFHGMRVEITHERPEFRHDADEDDPFLQEKLRILTQAARRSSFVRDQDGNLIRRVNSSRGGSARRLSLGGAEPLAPLVASASAPALGVAPGPSFGVVGGDEEQNGDDQHGTQGPQGEIQVTEEAPLKLQPKQHSSPLSSERDTIVVEDQVPSESIAGDTSLQSDPPAAMEVVEDDSAAVDDTIPVDPEVILEHGLRSPRESGQAVLSIADQDAPSPPLLLAIEPLAEATQISARPGVTPPHSLAPSPIASPRRQTCWDDAATAEAESPVLTHDQIAPSESQHEESGSNPVDPPSEQAVRPPRLRPASADVPSTRFDLLYPNETSQLSPKEASSDSGGACEDEEPQPLGPVSIQPEDSGATQPDSPAGFLSPRVSLAPEPTDQSAPDNTPADDPVEDCKQSSSSALSNFDGQLEPPTVEQSPAGDTLMSREQVLEEAAVSDTPLEPLAATQLDTEAPMQDLKADGVSQCDNTLDAINSEASTSEEAEPKRFDEEDPAPNRSSDQVSASNEQESQVTAVVSTAVITDTQASSTLDTPPPSDIRPDPGKCRSHSSSDGDLNPKASEHPASPSSSQRGGPALPRDPRHPPGKKRASVRQHPGQPLTDIKLSSRRKSVVKVTSPTLPDLSRPGAATVSGDQSTGSSGSKTHDDTAQSKSSAKNRRRQSNGKSLALAPSAYHKTWSKWANGRGVIETISCLQLEEQVLSGQQSEGALVKLGLRYARWSGTSLAAILLLEHAAALHESAPRSHEFWNSMGNAHLDIFLRHRKFLPAASFHLERCVKALTRALAFMESMADPLLLLRFALCLFWRAEPGHLERADEIFRQLLAKFASFVDRDRVNLLFLNFQALHRLRMFAEASECVDKIIPLVSSTAPSAASPTPQSRLKAKEDEASTLLPVYDLGDYCMMKMQCQQAAGDYMQATATFSRVLDAKGFVQDGSLTDEQYLELWLGVADKCFYLEDYALAAEYFPVALNFAKESQLLASMHYKLGLCFQALGDSQRCVAEYKRARNMNRHERPPVSLAELRGSYDAQFAELLDKSVRLVIEEVRVNLYDRAVRQLQRVFRLKRRAPAEGDSAESPAEVKMPSIVSRKLSRPASRSRPVSSPPHVLESAGAAGTHAVVESEVVDASESVAVLEETEGGMAARRQAEFQARKEDALDQMQKLRAAAFDDGHPPGIASNSTRATRGTTQSELLSPAKDRPEVRRLRSMATFNHLGYLPSTAPCVKHWEKLLALATDLFSTRRSVTRSTCAIRSVLPRVSDEVAFCALADALGDVDSAVERLRSPTYERELSFVCSVIDVDRKLEQALPVRLPSISSPLRSTESTATRAASSLSPSALATSVQAKRSHLSSPLVSPRPMRLDQMIDVQFQQRPQARADGVASAQGGATHGMANSRVLHEDLAVLRDFRQVNSTLMALQPPFGLPKSTG